VEVLNLQGKGGDEEQMWNPVRKLRKIFMKKGWRNGREGALFINNTTTVQRGEGELLGSA
jgi:hypothetical protein